MQPNFLYLEKPIIMAQSKCISCNNTTFETKEAKISGSNFRKYFIQCSKCGGVVGVTSFYNTNTLIEKLAKALNINLHR